MTRQIYNTRGMSIESINRILDVKKEIDRPRINEKIEILKDKLDCELFIRQGLEQEIDYLEKYIARKEKENVRKG